MQQEEKNPKFNISDKLAHWEEFKKSINFDEIYSDTMID
jgi:hypothetical protein